MKHSILAAAAAVLAAAFLTACTQLQLDKLNASLDRFDAAVERIDATIAKASPKLYAKCQSAQSWGTKLLPLVQALNKTAATGLSIVNDALRAGCQTAPADITGAIIEIAAAGEAGYQAYLAAKAGG